MTAEIIAIKPRTRRQHPPLDQLKAYSIADFCQMHGLSVSCFYALRKQGRAPRMMRVGRRWLISIEAAADWRQAQESTEETSVHQLYRYFDAEGNLLYVGISKSAVVRMAGHSKASWFPSVARIEIETFDSYGNARAAEWKAIRDEQPRFNLRP